MTKYLINRILRSIVSVMLVVAVVMVLIYSLMDRNLIFAADPLFSKTANNQKEEYKYRKWEEYGYLDYVPYTDWLSSLVKSGEIDDTTRNGVAKIGKKAEADTPAVAEYVARYTEYYESQGYKVVRLDAQMTGKKYKNGGNETLFAWKNKPLTSRVVSFFGGLFTVDNIHSVEEDIGERKLSLTMKDPVYGGEKFSPAIMGNGTQHKYLVYFDNQFPYFHQNLLSLNLGKSYVTYTGRDVFNVMTDSQGSYVQSEITYPTGLTENSADDLHTATYSAGSLASSAIAAARFTDDYTNVTTISGNMSKMGFSFVIGLIATIIAYCLGVPLGVVMARNKDKLVDQIGTFYIVFIMAVPSLAYIFMFKAFGGAMGLPTTFDMESNNKLMFVLPIISLALPSIGSLMKWMRRYMIDQMNSDYVKFARSGGLSESEIFSKHIMKNAIIPIAHGVPASVLGALTGAIITERVYVVPGAGNLLTTAINNYDNGVIVGMTLFYATLSVISIIMGDVVMSMVDPRISFSSKAR